MQSEGVALTNNPKLARAIDEDGDSLNGVADHKSRMTSRIFRINNNHISIPSVVSISMGGGNPPLLIKYHI